MQEKDIRELVNQESFLNYCFKRNNEDVLYWENWLSENARYRKGVEDLRQMLIVMGDESRNRMKEEDFALLQEKISQLEQQTKVKIHPLWRRLSIAAAVIFIIAGAGLFFYNRMEPGLQNAKANDIAPGGNKATLILASGKRVNLTDASNGAVASQAGIKVVKTADGQIIYEVADINADGSADVFNTIETPLGGQYQVNLSDGTKGWLNSGSSLRYPLKFKGNERRVLLVGEGYFEVAHNKQMPFKVVSGKQTVEVLGTHFNIMAYTDEKIIKTSLLQGSVNVSYSGAATQLIPGQQSQLVSEKIRVIDDADMEEVIAWKNGYFKFNEGLVSIMNKISRWYGVEVIYKTKPDPSLTYSGKISRSRNISAILKIIEFDGDVHFKIDGKRVYVTN